MSHGLGGCGAGVVCSDWALMVGPVKDLLPGMMSVPLFEPGMMAGGLLGSFLGSTSTLELGIMVGFDCFCVNQTQLNNKPSDEQMAARRSAFILAGYQNGHVAVDSKVAACSPGTGQL